MTRSASPSKMILTMDLIALFSKSVLDSAVVTEKTTNTTGQPTQRPGIDPARSSANYCTVNFGNSSLLTRIPAQCCDLYTVQNKGAAGLGVNGLPNNDPCVDCGQRDGSWCVQ
jgi:hypothetical protein